MHAADEPTRHLLRKEALRPVTARDGDTTFTMPATEAVIRSIAVSAMKGRPMAQRTYLAHALAEDARYRAERREDFDFWIDYRDRMLADIAECHRNGKPASDPTRRPDDMRFDHVTLEVRFLGAWNASTKMWLDGVIALRDYSLIRSFEYDGPCSKVTDTSGGVGMFLLVYAAMESLVPPRLKLDDGEFMRRGWAHARASPAERRTSIVAMAAKAKLAAPAPRRRRQDWSPSISLAELRDHWVLPQLPPGTAVVDKAH